MNQAGTPPLDSEREAERAQVSRTRWFGAAMIPVGLWTAYHFIVWPLEEARHAGQIESSLKGVVLGPLAVYLGVAILATDLRDGQVRTFDAQGRKRYTRKGKLFLAGAVVVIALTMAAWFSALHAMGLTSNMS